MKYYISAGAYYNYSTDRYELGIVGPTKGLPYITTDPKGIPHTSHHSSVYELSEDFNEAYLVKNHWTAVSPKKVKLHLSDVLKLLEAKKKFEESQAH